MTEEEKEAINNLWSSATDVMFNVLYSQEQLQKDIKTVLNLIQKQQVEKEQLKAEIEKKDKIINEMAKWIFDKDYTENSLLIHRDNYYSNCIKQVKHYFEKKVED